MPRKIENPEDIWAEKRQSKKTDIAEWKRYWKEAGPIRFAEEYLKCPLNVPPYPDWELLQEEYYCHACKKRHMKFHDNGVPYHIILSDGQKEVFTDAWLNGVMLILISAGRGAGKTFSLAIWNCWKLATHDDYEITTMGGAAKQSKLCQKYIDYWRGQHPELKYIINESRKSIGNRVCKTRFSTENNYVACSPTAVMGPHVNEVQIDEECAAESKGVEGEEAIEAIDWQITGRRNTYIWRTSTSHYILGQFYEILKNPDRYGYKVYIWGTVKHKSGKPSYLMYGDKNPENWEPAVWWMTKEDIKKLRKKSDEEWLCWALGHPSLASGSVFREKDLDVCICNLCDSEDGQTKSVDVCKPYDWKQCKLVKKYNLGDEQDTIKNVRERAAGFDYGDPSPCALIIGGVRNKRIFVLYSDEQKGLSTKELTQWISNKLSVWKTFMMNIPDSVGGNFVREDLDEKGYTIHLLEEQEKGFRVLNMKGIVERHAIIIPPAYWYLVKSLRGVHRDKGGKIKKFNDHSFDGCCYMCIEWGEIEGNPEEFFDLAAEEGLHVKLHIPDDPDNKDPTLNEDTFFDNLEGIQF